MEKTILVVAYDGSAGSRTALAGAVEWAERLEACIHLVSVPEFRWTGFDPAAVFELLGDEQERRWNEMLREGMEFCAARHVPVLSKLLKGHPAEAIIQYAQEVNAALIIAGVRGQGGFERLMLGGVAHKLVAYAKTPVMVIR